MIKRFLSYYRPRYLRSLIYMLQASEYHAGEYLAWFWKVRDFGAVEKRKHLVKTKKAMLLLALAILLAVVLLLLACSMFWLAAWPVNIVLFIVIILAGPYLIACGIVVPLYLAEIVIQKPLVFFALRRTKRALAKHKALKIGVAGSFGKTSMREILKATLSAGKKVAAPPESYNTPLGIAKFVAGLRGDEEILIFELGEYYPGDVRKLCRIVQPDWGFVTGVNEAHLEKFRTLARTAGTIFEIGEFLDPERLYVNAESLLAKKYASSGNIFYSREGVGDAHVADPKTGLDGTSFTFIKDDAKLTMQSKLLGLHNIGPLAAAADIALRLGLSPAQVEEGIRKTAPFNHRLEPKIDASGVITLDDSYNGNPDGVRAVIDFLGSLAGHRRWYVTPGLVEMGPRTGEVHREIGRELAAAGIEKTVLVEKFGDAIYRRGAQRKKLPGRDRLV